MRHLHERLRRFGASLAGEVGSAIAPLLLAASFVSACTPPFEDEGIAIPALTATVDGGDATSVAAGATASDPNAPHASADNCKTCHANIYAQWSQSMHAQGLRSPLTVAQTNLAATVGFASDPAPETKRVCVNCHGPVAALQTKSAMLPIPGGNAANEGVTCVACHAVSSAPVAGSGSGPLLAKIEPGRTYYGPLSDPVANTFHQSRPSNVFQNADALCGSCHNVHVDRNRDGRATKGIDLVLQTTFDEYGEYLRAGGSSTCAQCHMPVVPGLTRAADTAAGGPARQVHDHSFVGVDYPLDQPSDPLTPKRQALLRGAASMAIVGRPVVSEGQLTFAVAVQNLSGHDLPTGFAFARQMWLEVQAAAFGRTLFTSGVLARPSDDLCDAATLTDALAPHVVGCSAVDAPLANIQLKLVERVAPEADANGQAKVNERGELVLAAVPGARETVVQFLPGGPIARKRPTTGEALVPIRPFETRVLRYAVPFPGGAPGAGMLRVRLLFRSIAPYFIRAMAAVQMPGDPVRLGPLVNRLEVTEMATSTTAF